MSNSLDPDQARCFVGPDLGPNCLQNYQQTTQGRVKPVLRGVRFVVLFINSHEQTKLSLVNCFLNYIDGLFVLMNDTFHLHTSVYLLRTLIPLFAHNSVYHLCIFSTPT